jgi:hypothetical protein
VLDLGVQSAILTVPWAGLIGTGSAPGGHRQATAVSAAMREWRRPDGLDLARLPDCHLAFGGGIHLRLGRR